MIGCTTNTAQEMARDASKYSDSFDAWQAAVHAYETGDRDRGQWLTNVAARMEKQTINDELRRGILKLSAGMICANYHFHHIECDSPFDKAMKWMQNLDNGALQRATLIEWASFKYKQGKTSIACKMLERVNTIPVSKRDTAHFQTIPFYISDIEIFNADKLISRYCSQ